MELIKLHVSSFGKLKDYDYCFAPDLNVFMHENGWGKSTLATFIKSMFYGLKDSKRSIEENERIKYKPWNSTEKFGGYVVFKVKNSVYRLERYFGTKESEDSVKLYDENTGKEYSKTEDIGKRLFKIDEDGFTSTTYFSQKDLEIKSNSSLTAKYNEVYEIQDTALYDNAVKKLEEKVKSYKYSGDRGIIPDLKRNGFIIDEKINESRNAESSVYKIKEEVDRLNGEVERLKTESDELTTEVQKAGKSEANKLKKERLEKARADKSKAQEELNGVRELLRGNSVDLEQLNDVKLLIDDLDKSKERENIIREDINSLKGIKGGKSFGTLNILLTVFGGIFIALGIVLSFINLIIGIIIGVFGLILLTVGLVLYFVKGNTQNPLLGKKEKDLLECVNLNAQTQAGIEEYFKKYNLDDVDGYKEKYSVILDAVERGKKAKERIISADEEVKNIDVDESLDREPIINVEEVNGKLKSVNALYREKAEVLANKNASLIRLINTAEEMTEFLSMKAENENLIAEKSKELDVLKTTLEYLKKADENLKLKYRNPLKESLNKYLLYIDKTQKADIDIDLNLSVEEESGKKSTEYYSKGYQNLFDIVKRFALTDILFEDEKPFMMLDDPFYNLDEEKVDSGLKLIKELSKEYQILYFVCHKSRAY